MESGKNNVAIVILAAGKGTRMKSDKAKVLHELKGRPMISYVVETAHGIAGDDVIVVIGHQKEEVRESVLKTAKTRFSIQEEQKGTGHAVMCALTEIQPHVRSVIVLCGDVPLIERKTIEDLIKKHDSEGCDVTVLTVHIDKPTGYGRIIMGPDGSVTRIVEEADANEEEKKVTLINSGIYCIETGFLKDALYRIKDDNNQGELYLTDIIGIAHDDGRKIGMSLCPTETEVIGVNTLDDLKRAEGLMSCNEL